MTYSPSSVFLNWPTARLVRADFALLNGDRGRAESLLLENFRLGVLLSRDATSPAELSVGRQIVYETSLKFADYFESAFMDPNHLRESMGTFATYIEHWQSVVDECPITLAPYFDIPKEQCFGEELATVSLAWEVGRARLFTLEQERLPQSMEELDQTGLTPSVDPFHPENAFLTMVTSEDSIVIYSWGLDAVDDSALIRVESRISPTYRQNIMVDPRASSYVERQKGDIAFELRLDRRYGFPTSDGQLPPTSVTEFENRYPNGPPRDPFFIQNISYSIAPFDEESGLSGIVIQSIGIERESIRILSSSVDCETSKGTSLFVDGQRVPLCALPQSIRQLYEESRFGISTRFVQQD